MATLPVPTPVEQPTAAISPIGRIFGVLFSPKATFEDIVRTPSWILPMVLFLLFSMGAVIALNSHFDWRQYMTQQIEQNPRTAQLSPEQKQQQIDGGAKFAPIFSYVSGAVIPIVGVIIISLIMMAAYNLFAGAGVNFKTSVAIVSHAFVPTLISSILFVIILFLKPIGDFDLENPVASNLAALFPADAPKWLQAFGRNIDVFLIWVLALLAIGFACTNPRKLKGSKPWAIAFGLFIAWIVVRVGLAFAFS